MTQQDLPLPYYLRPNQLQRALNKEMTQLIPELESNYAQTPLCRDAWNKPSDTLPDGTRCFQSAPLEGPRHRDYIWMPARKDLEAGYYHLSTQEAYIQVVHLLRQQRPRRRLFRAKPQVNKNFDKIYDLVYNRLLSDKPNDLHAARIKLLQLQSEGGRAAAFGKATYLPALTTGFLIGA